MRHADVCTCRDCGVARLNAIMEGMPDTEGKLVVAFAGIQVGNAPLRSEDVALPYAEVNASAERMGALLDQICIEVSRHARLDGYMPDSVSELEGKMRAEINALGDSWRRDP